MIEFPGRARRFADYLAGSADGRLLALFRVLYGFGLLLALAMLWPQLEPLYLAPEFHFAYPGLGWIRPWPGWGLYGHVAVMAFCALAIAAGWRYRSASALLSVSAAYLLLLERSYYLDVFYLLVAFSLLMCFVPAQRTWSLDARRAAQHDGTVPKWAGLAVQVILAVLMFAAVLGMARVYGRAETLVDGLRTAGLLPAIFILAFSAAGLLIFALGSGFQRAATAAGPTDASLTLPAMALFCAFLLGHALFPLRGFVSPGGLAWIDSGGNPLKPQSCGATFSVREAAGSGRWSVSPYTQLHPRQALAVSAEPERVLQFAHHLKQWWAQRHRQQVEVRARVRCTLDGVSFGPVLDPRTDLSGLAEADLPQLLIPFKPELPGPSGRKPRRGE